MDNDGRLVFEQAVHELQAALYQEQASRDRTGVCWPGSAADESTLHVSAVTLGEIQAGIELRPC